MSNKRVAKLRDKLESKGLSAILVASPINRRYLTGFTGSAGYVLITPEQSYLLTDFRYMTQAPQQAVGFHVVEHAPKVMDTVKELLGAELITSLGFEQDHVTYGVFSAYSEQLAPIHLVPVSGMIEELRIIKDADELAIMQRAADLADETFSHVLTILQTGKTEREIDLEMEMFMRKRGATSSSFDTIVASGERSALPHGVAASVLFKAMNSSRLILERCWMVTARI
ncbi:3-oxoacyl-[acyl-carrier protein] reductase [Paenibacillus sp. JCM 10914]|nr:3-oxoacyl-[acyl-carrier protein] reductase [Paenibacillus sp. JCM 10914]